jgi:hypothetical protein
MAVFRGELCDEFRLKHVFVIKRICGGSLGPRRKHFVEFRKLDSRALRPGS